MTLSIKEMDDINVLLTEVSLELLGNKFYDIHGQVHGTLRELYLPDVTIDPGYSVDKCDFVKNLNLDPKLLENSQNSNRQRKRKQKAAVSSNEDQGPSSTAPAPTLSVEETIKSNVAAELARESQLSEDMKLAYFKSNRARMEVDYVDEYEIAQEYYTNEKKQMMVDSGALIEMIKYIKADPANAKQINEIATNILHIKDDI